MVRPVVLNTLTQPSGQTVDGSLKFERTSDTDNTYLERTSTTGNSKKWTWSGWIKLDKIGNTMRFFGGNGGSSGNADWLSAMIADTGHFRLGAYSVFPRQSNEYFRDPTGWYHFCIAVDIDATTDNKYRVWANGQELTWSSKSDQTNTGLNRNGYVHYIGAEIQGAGGSQNNGFGGKMTQVNFIDGLALGPEYFAFRDPVTNAWRPNKFEAKGTTVNNGTDWSSNYSGTAQPTQAFTGNGPVQDGYAHQSGGLTLTFPSPGLTGRIIVYGGTGGGGADTYTLSDGSSLSSAVQYDTAPYYEALDFGEKKNITSLVCSAGYTLYAISVDGVFMKDSTTETISFGTNGYYLPMDGSSSMAVDHSGNGNDFTPNKKFKGTNSVDKATGALPILDGFGAVPSVAVRPDGRNYSDNTTASGGFNSSYPKTNLFDGRPAADGNRAEADSNDDAIDITFSPAINVSSTISLWSGKSSTRYQINNSGSYTTYSDAVGSYKDISHSGALTNLKILHGSAGQAAGISAIKIDGTQLVDHNGIVLAMPLVGIATDLSSDINSAVTSKSVTVNSAAANSESILYGGSYYFNGSSTIALGDLSSSNIEDFTFESWCYLSNVSSQYGFFSNQTSDNGANTMRIGTSGGDEIWMKIGSSSLQTPDASLVAGEWFHLAVTRSSNNVTIYLNGVNRATMTATDAISPSGFYLGVTYPTTSFRLNGYMQDVRFYTTAKYKTDFVPASPTPEFIPDTPSGVVGSSKLTKITDGSVAFDGAGGQYLRVEDADMALGTGDFTVEAFIYNKVNRNYVNYIGTRESGQSTSDGWCIASNAAGDLYWYSNGLYDTLVFDDMSTDKWYHVACTRESGTHKWFVDGVLQGTNTTSRDYTDDLLTIGDNSYFTSTSNDEPLEGFVSNVRIVKGTALYTTDFTPPTEPLTTTSQSATASEVKLLCCQSTTQPGAAVTSPNMDSVNDGRQWSAGTFLGSIEAARPWPLGFNGDLDTFTRPTSGNMATIIFDTPISFSSKFEIKGTRDSGSVGSIEVMDATNRFVDVTSSFGNVTANPADYPKVNLTSSLTSPVKAIRFNGTNDASSQPRFTGVYVDDTLLVDPVATSGVGTDGSTLANEFNPFNTNINTVRGQETGYPTLNPLYPNPNGNVTSDGNLRQTTTAGNGQYNATMAIPQTGSWYWEVTKESSGAPGIIGISDPKVSSPSHNANNVGAFSWYTGGPRKQTSGVDISYGNGVSQGDVIGVGYNSDLRELRFYLNGQDQGVAFDASDIAAAEYFPAFSAGSSASTFTYSVNFGQKPFKFPPPDGYLPLNLANTRPERVITNPTQYIGITTYKGTGSAQFLSLGFEPDLMWSKTTSQSVDHKLVDSVRGLSKVQEPNQSRADSTASTGITATNPGGFSVGSSGDFNTNGRRYVTWCWKAGGSKGTFNVDGVGYASASEVNMNVGGKNSLAFDQSQTWSSNSASDSRGFNGSLAYDSNATRLYGTGTYHKVLNSTTYFTDVTSLRIGTSENVGNVKIDGVVFTTTYLSGVGLTVTNPPAKFKEIEILGASSGVQLSYIMINGVILVDNGATPSVNYPTIASDACSVGTKNGFSIVQYEGNGTTNQSIAHGLDKKPDLVIIKNMSEAYSWAIWLNDLSLSGDVAHNSPEYDMLSFDTNGESNFSEDCIWDVFDHSLKIHNTGSGNWVNKDGNNYIMYSWSNVPGLQKFGKYIGNGNNSGPFIELGFRPALLITKRIGTNGNNWQLLDSVRSPSNPANWVLKPDEAGQETTDSDYATDFLSNGFKHRTSHAARNATSDEYIYMAWAEAAAIDLFGQSNAR